MIRISELTEKDVGREVIYMALEGRAEFNCTIVSWGLLWINIKYKDDDDYGIDGVSVEPCWLRFKSPLKPVEIITRADLIDLDD